MNPIIWKHREPNPLAGVAILVAGRSHFISMELNYEGNKHLLSFLHFYQIWVLKLNALVMFAFRKLPATRCWLVCAHSFLFNNVGRLLRAKLPNPRLLRLEPRLPRPNRYPPRPKPNLQRTFGIHGFLKQWALATS